MRRRRSAAAWRLPGKRTSAAIWPDCCRPGGLPGPFSRRRSALRQFFLFCAAEGYRGDNPADRLDAPKIGRPLPRHLGIDELRAIIEAVESFDGPARLRLGCIVELLYGAGLRVSELVGLAMSDVPPGRDWLTVRGKGGRERVVPLGGPARAAIDAWTAARPRCLAGRQALALAVPFPQQGRPSDAAAGRPICSTSWRFARGWTPPAYRRM